MSQLKNLQTGIMLTGLFLMLIMAAMMTSPSVPTWLAPAALAQGDPGDPGGGSDPPDPPRDPVPEPATALLIGIGAAGVYGYKKLTGKK